MLAQEIHEFLHPRGIYDVVPHAVDQERTDDGPEQEQGGVFSFLPVLGLWMLPLGLLVLAVDIPPLRRPVGDAIVRLQRTIARAQRWFRERLRKSQ